MSSHRNKKKYTIRKNKVNEVLKHKIITKNNKKTDLSTSLNHDNILHRGDEWVWSSESENSFLDYSINKNVSKYSIWRNMPLRFVEVAETITLFINNILVPPDDIDDLMFKPVFKKISNIDIETQKEIQERWNRLYSIADFDVKGEEYFTGWYTDGIQILEGVYDNNDMKSGIQDILVADPKNMKKRYDKSLKKSYWVANNSDGSDEKKNRLYDDQVSVSTSGLWDSSSKMYLSYLERAINSLNKLDSVETSVLTYCLTRSMEKTVYYVDVGRLKESKKKAKVREVANTLRTKARYDKRTGSVTNTPAKIQLGRDIFIATNGGEKSTTIDNISADRFDLGDLSSLNNFREKAYRSLGSKMLMNNKEATYHFDSPSEVEKDELDLFKLISIFRKKWIAGWRDILLKDCIAIGVISSDRVDFFKRSMVFEWNNNSDYRELRKLKKLEQQLELVDKVSDYVKRNGEEELSLFDIDFVYETVLGWDSVKTTEMKKKLKGEVVKSNDDVKDKENTKKTDDEQNTKSSLDFEPSDEPDDEEIEESLISKLNESSSKSIKKGSVIIELEDVEDIDNIFNTLEEGNILHLGTLGVWQKVDGQPVEITKHLL